MSVILCQVLPVSAWTIQLGPIVNGGNCFNINLSVDMYVNGTLSAPNFQASSIVPLGCWPACTGTSTFSGIDHPGQTVTFKIRITSAFPEFDPPFTFGSGSLIAGTFGDVGKCNPTNYCMVTNQTFSYVYTNQSPAAIMVVAMLDGSLMCGNAGGSGANGSMIVPPGTVGTLTTPVVQVGCGATDGNVTFAVWTYQGWQNDTSGCLVPSGSQSGPSAGPTFITGGGGGGTGSGGSSGGGGSTGGSGGQGSTGGGTNTPDPTYYPTNVAPIVYNTTNSPGGTNVATDGTMQNGFNALYDAINRNGANAAQSLALLDADQRAQQVVLQNGTNIAGQAMLVAGNGFANTTNLLMAETNLMSQVTNLLFRDLVNSTNGYNAISNAVVGSGSNITNWLGSEISSNMANARMLSNAIGGISNAVIASGTNQGLFLSNAFYSVMSGLTNGSGNGSNVFDVASVTNDANANTLVLSNGLNGIAVAFSNELYAETNGQGIAGLIPGSATNQLAALAAGNLSSADAQGAVDSAVSEIGSPPVGGDGSMPSMVLAIAGTSIDISPESIAPGISAALKAMLSMVALLAFGLSAGTLFWQATQTYAVAQTGGVPDVDVAGINILGVSAAVAVPAVFIGIWVAVFTGIFSLITSGLAGLASSSFSLPNSTAIQILRAVFPVDLMLSLAWTRIVMHFAVGKLVIISASASRYLFGR